jgi:hypothetical protein
VEHVSGPNPYAAPQADAPRAPRPGPAQGFDAATYVPLGWRTALAAISVLGMTAADGVMRLAQLAIGDSLDVNARTGTAPDLATVALLGAAGLGVSLMSVASWVFVPVWMHRASSNLRGLGQYGMQFSPGGCAGWFFVPIANLWKPVQAMAELWRASDPDTEQGGWFASASTPLLGIWWATYLVSGFVSYGSILTKDSPSTAATIGLASVALRAVAAIALVLLMRGVSARQEAMASKRLSAAY